MPKESSSDVSLNLNVRGMPPSATLAINEYCAKLLAQGRKVYKFGLGQSPFPVPEQVVAALQQNAFQKDYLPVQGLPALRDVVAEHLHRRQNIPCSGDDVLVGPGSKELMFLLQLVFYGDLVIPRPSWVSYAPQANIIGRNVNWVNTTKENDWHLMPDELERICADDPHRPRIVILNYPANPTGGTYLTEDLRQLAKVARQYNLILLSDEIYGDLHHKGQHVSIARFYPEGTIVSTGISKWAGAGGWRLGVFVFPESLQPLLKGMASVASETYTSTSAPIQYAAVRAYEGSAAIERYLLLSRRILGALGRHCTKSLQDAGVDVAAPKGAFYLFPDFSSFRETLSPRGITTSRDLCKQLLDDTGVALLPGSDFGQPDEELTARLSYVDFNGQQALDAAKTQPKETPLSGDYLATNCPRVLEGIDLISDWLTRS